MDESAGSRRLMRRMLAFLSHVKLPVALVTLTFIASIAAEVVTVYLLKPAVNIVKGLESGETATVGTWAWLTAAGGSGADLRHALLLLLAAKLIHGILVWARSVSTSWQNMSLVFHMRAALYDRLQRVGFAFHSRYPSGWLINRALSDLGHVRNFVNVGLHSSLDILFSCVGYFGMLLANSTTLALASLVPVPLWLWALRHFARRSRPIYRKHREAGDEVVRRMTEHIAGIHVIRAFSTEDRERAAFDAARAEHLGRALEAVSLQRLMTPVLRGIFVGTQICLFGAGAVLVQRGALELGDLVIFGVAMNVLLAKLQQINSISDAYQHAMVSGGRVFEILDTPDSPAESPRAVAIAPGPGHVRFAEATFSFQPTRVVLQDISFEVPAGAKIALLGPTGCGKTALSLLLGRFYDPEKGAVLIDGQDVRDVTLRSLRHAVGYVFQESYLFSDTVANNIAYGDSDTTREEIERAARAAHAHEFIEHLPYGYDTILGEYGAGLSGGQRQRLAIARAILYAPRILVLDDALSAVDPETEAEIRRDLETIMAGRTVFLITSRISVARAADRIVVLERGRIAQIGTHEELMAREGFYRSVAESQFGNPGPSAASEASHIGRLEPLAPAELGSYADAAKP